MAPPAAPFSVLDATFSALASVRAELRDVGVRLTMWANPAITRATFGERVSANWPLLAFDEMVMWCLLYAAIATYGVFARSAYFAARRDGKGAAAEPKAAAAAKKGDAAPAAPWSWSATSAKLARDPLKALMVLYNLVQVVVCSAMCVDVLLVVLAPGYYPESPLSPFCTGARWRREHDSRVARVHWVFYVSKLLDFMDTVFIIARNKWEQFIPLHIYHHLSVFPVQWLIQTAAPDGDTWWPVFANAFVHVVMYAYYGLSALDLKPTWGKYLTMLQITQFLSMIAHSSFLAINQPAPHTLLPAGLLPFTCAFPFWTAVVYGSYVFSLLVLFLAFFNRKHGGKGAKAAAADKAE